MNQPRCMTIRSAMTAFAIAVLMATALLPLSLRAQNSYGSIVGIVTDSSGAVVPDASVTVTNIGTGIVVKTQSDGGGKYSVADLLPADYRVEAEKSGFKRTNREHVDVEVGATVRIDFSLAVGSAAETVEVTTATPLLQTDTSSMNQEVQGDVVQQMPLNGRNVMNLIELAPGVIPAGGASGSTALDQTTGRTAGGVGWNNYEIGGAIQGWSSNYIDGAPNSLYGDNILALVPTQDAVQEFSVVSSNATADFGRFAGGVVNMSTKSGTNAFHGSVYEYFRNTDFNANLWFNNHSNIARSEWNQNQYGAAVNGPIKKDKAFFMFTWESFKALTDITNTTNVPTAAMQNGTFTKAISDPLGNCTIANNGNGTYTITNLYVPGSNCGDPLNEILKQYYPLPNANAAAYNWILSTPLSNTQAQYNGRIDYNLSSKQRIFGRYSYWAVTDSHQTTFNDQGSPAPGSTTATKWPTSSVAPKYPTQQGVLGDTYTLNATTVLDVRANYIRQTATGNPDSSNAVNESQFGSIYAALAPQLTEHVLPVMVPSGGDNLYQFGGTSNGNVNWYNTYSINASVVKILGPHSLKAGVEARLMDNSGTPFYGRAAGYYNYDSVFTGDEFASFLMGYPGGNTAFQFQTFQYTAGYSYYQGYYVKDDWQATRKLTLNVGLRYELPGAPAERNNKLAVLLPNAVDPNTGITGTEALVNSPLYGHRTAVVEKYNLFAPRVGFAYRASDNTVLRGGYGISYLPDDLAGPNGAGTLPPLAPFVVASTTAVVSEATPYAPVPLQTALGCIANGPTPSTAAVCNATTLSTAGLNKPAYTPPSNFMQTLHLAGTPVAGLYPAGASLQGPVPYQSYPYVQQWNASLSHQFKGDLMAEVSYVGLKGTNLPQIGKPPQTYFGINELQSQYYSLIAQTITYQGKTYNGLTAPIAAPGTTPCNVKGPGLVGSTTVGQCLRPNPYYADMQDSARSTAIQNYKSFQVNAQKRLGAGGMIMSNYTWSKNMADTDTANQQLETTSAPHVGNGTAGLQDYNNVGNEYSLISYDVTNRFVLDYELTLPFGKGQKYVNSLGDLGNAFASGWAINGITIFQSGFPIFMQSATGNLLTSNWGAGQLRPNVVPGCNKQVAGGNQTKVLNGAWFNTSCFTKAVTGADPNGQVTFGNEPRVDPQLRADGIKNFDFAFQKSTPIWESSNFVFRAEFFNIMNRVQFSPPNNSYAAPPSSFGAVTSQANKPRQIQLSARINF